MGTNPREVSAPVWLGHGAGAPQQRASPCSLEFFKWREWRHGESWVFPKVSLGGQFGSTSTSYFSTLYRSPLSQPPLQKGQALDTAFAWEKVMPNFASVVKAVGEPKMDSLGSLLHIWGKSQSRGGGGRGSAPSTEAALGLLGAPCCSGCALASESSPVLLLGSLGSQTNSLPMGPCSRPPKRDLLDPLCGRAWNTADAPSLHSSIASLPLCNPALVQANEDTTLHSRCGMCTLEHRPTALRREVLLWGKWSHREFDNPPTVPRPLRMAELPSPWHQGPRPPQPPPSFSFLRFLIHSLPLCSLRPVDTHSSLLSP